MYQTDDVRINKVKELLPPVAVLERFPATETASSTTFNARNAIHNMLKDEDDRLLVIIGPCSIHDPKAAIEYGERLKELSDAVDRSLFIVMRAYFEKPRTTTGWKGLINDPDLNDTFDIVSQFPVDLHIFNRWGQLVHQSLDYQNNWDGGDLAAGTYYYNVVLPTGEQCNGWLEIIDGK